MRSSNTKGIRSFAKTAAKAASLGASTLALGGAGALAQTSDVVTVTGERAAELSSPRYTAPLLNTPQTVTVVSAELIEEQNLLGLRDILSTVPGITFGAGEGGGGYGDSINLRGYSANGDITTDGVRDSAQYSRTDPFNLEQVEITNGANSVYGGAGSVGGTINLATKRPFDMERTVLDLGFGTDAYGRATLDMNKPLSDRVSARLNVMAHSNNVPGRDVEQYDRWGIAPSVSFDVTDSTTATLLYIHQEDDNIPQYGVPYALNPFNNGPLPGVDSSSYFGYANVDTQDIEQDIATLIVDHEFGSNLTLRNLTRWGQVSQYAVINALQGSWCVAPGIDPYTGAACAQAGYAPGGPRGNLRDTTNWILTNQTDLTARFATGGLSHTLVVGASFTEEKYKLDGGNVQRTATGDTPAYPLMSLSDPFHFYTGPINRTITSAQRNSVQNAAVYAFDRIEIGEQFEINGGLRYEHNEGEGQSYSFGAPPASVVTVNPPTGNEDDLISYRVGLVYKPVENASLYVAYGNSQSPSQSTVNGACNVATTCNVDPEEAVNYEIGGKYEAFGGRILLTAALFRNERSQFRVDSGIPGVQQVLDGSSKVDGVSLGAAGLITENWSVFANYTYLDSELQQSVSDVSLAGGALDFRAGDPLPNTPDHAASLWTTYELPDLGLTVGYGITYQGEYTFNRFNAAAPLFYTDPYWVHRAMVAWSVTDRARLQLNVNNLFDEEYFERIRNNAGNGWATPGAARSAVLSLQYRF